MVKTTRIIHHNQLLLTKFRKNFVMLNHILGDPGATSWNNAIVFGESLLKELKSPWELILNEPVPEVVEISEDVQPGNSVALLHEIVFFIDRPSCLARKTGKFS